MKNLRVARRYAAALMTASGGDAAVERTAKDLEAIVAVMASSPDFRRMVGSPVVSPAKKTAVFREIFGARVSAGTMEFLVMVIHKQREPHLAEIIEQFGVLRDDRLGIVNVRVTAATALTAAEEKDLLARLERYTKKKVRVHIAVDAAIKGGLVVRIGDTVLDASIRRQLELLRERFVNAGPHAN
jgi:F-type H+-transporting ATPase subunit delta